MSDADRPLAVVDIDGVLADVRHRLHHLRRRPKDWQAFFAAARHDEALPEGLAVVERLRDDHEVVLLTGRPRELEADTRVGLDEHGLGDLRLVMRPSGDRRPAAWDDCAGAGARCRAWPIRHSGTASAPGEAARRLHLRGRSRTVGLPDRNLAPRLIRGAPPCAECFSLP